MARGVRAGEVGTWTMLLLLACSLPVGCRPRQSMRPRGGSSVNFTLPANRLPYSLLNEMKSSGALTVCVGSPDATTVDEDGLRQRVEPSVRQVIGDWDRHLRDLPDWPHREEIAVAFEYRQRCQDYRMKPSEREWSKLKIDLFAQRQAFERHVCVPDHVDASTCRNTASTEWRAVWILGRINAVEFHHEFGHMLGVGDTGDEKRALGTILGYMKTGRLDCGPEHLPVTEVRLGALLSIFCTVR